MLPHIDIYPLVYEPFDRFALVRGKLDNVPPIEPGFQIHDPVDHAARAVRLHNNLLPSLIGQKLDSLPQMKAARALMPALRAIPEIRKYRVEYPHYSAAGVNTEMAAHGIPLHPGQVLFHGGVFPRANDGSPQAAFTTPNVLSTSLCAQVAAAHSTYHSPKDVWILRIAPGSTTRAIVLGFKGQSLGHEMEVLLGSGAQLTLQRIHPDGEYTLFEVDVF